jgi:hypothetical protein
MIAGAMVVMCLIFAYYLLFSDLIIDKLFGFKRNMMVALLLLYGTYRGWRLYSTIQKDKREKR